MIFLKSIHRCQQLAVLRENVFTTSRSPNHEIALLNVKEDVIPSRSLCVVEGRSNSSPLLAALLRVSGAPLPWVVCFLVIHDIINVRAASAYAPPSNASTGLRPASIIGAMIHGARPMMTSGEPRNNNTKRSRTVMSVITSW